MNVCLLTKITQATFAVEGCRRGAVWCRQDFRREVISEIRLCGDWTAARMLEPAAFAPCAEGCGAH